MGTPESLKVTRKDEWFGHESGICFSLSNREYQHPKQRLRWKGRQTFRSGQQS